MRRVISLLLSAAILLSLLCGCQRPAGDPGQTAPPDQEWTVMELAEAAFSHSGRMDRDGLETYSAETDQEWLEEYIENAYHLQFPWEEAAVIRAAGASAFEIAVLRMADEDAAVMAASSFMSYISSRQGDFVGYAPAEADMVANGGLLQKGLYAALFICPDPDGACDTVEAVLNGEEAPSPEPSPEMWVELPKVEAEAGAMLDYLLDVCGDLGDVPEDLERLDGGGAEALSAYMESAYGLERSQWQEAAIARDTGSTAFEIAVLKVENMDAVWDITELLLDYLDERIAYFDGRAPEQAEMILNTSVYRISGSSMGTYVILPICDSPMQVATLGFVMGADTTGSQTRHPGGEAKPPEPEYDGDYSDRIKFTQPNKDDMSLYDTSAILAAWEEDDPSGLSKEDRKIYDQAQKVLGKVLKDGMSDYEKEVAIYDWVVNNVDYDWTHQDVMATTPRESFTPYGGLVYHKAVCLGYATTFQLLMDLAGVECITVPGAAFYSEDDHGWNMVRLNGEWYCVDVTWDANQREQIGLKGLENWDYFNVTSDHMAETNHQWDYANTPEATAEDRGRG